MWFPFLQLGFNACSICCTLGHLLFFLNLRLGLVHDAFWQVHCAKLIHQGSNTCHCPRLVLFLVRRQVLQRLTWLKERHHGVSHVVRHDVTVGKDVVVRCTVPVSSPLVLERVLLRRQAWSPCVVLSVRGCIRAWESTRALLCVSQHS